VSTWRVDFEASSHVVNEFQSQLKDVLVPKGLRLLIDCAILGGIAALVAMGMHSIASSAASGFRSELATSVPFVVVAIFVGLVYVSVGGFAAKAASGIAIYYEGWGEALWLEADEQTVTLRGRWDSATTEWASLRRAYLTPDFLFLFDRRWEVLWVPLESFRSKDDRDAFIAKVLDSVQTFDDRRQPA